MQPPWCRKLSVTCGVLVVLTVCSAFLHLHVLVHALTMSYIVAIMLNNPLKQLIPLDTILYMTVYDMSICMASWQLNIFTFHVGLSKEHFSELVEFQSENHKLP